MRELRRILRSFPFAFAGLGYLVKTQSNARVHLVAAGAVFLASLILEIRGVELAVLVLAIAVVLVAEALNSALEATVDLSSPDRHPLAKVAKDVSAAAVLLAAVGAVGVGLIVVLPRLLALVGR